MPIELVRSWNLLSIEHQIHGSRLKSLLCFKIGQLPLNMASLSEIQCLFPEAPALPFKKTHKRRCSYLWYSCFPLWNPLFCLWFFSGWGRSWVCADVYLMISGSLSSYLYPLRINIYPFLDKPEHRVSPETRPRGKLPQRQVFPKNQGVATWPQMRNANWVRNSCSRSLTRNHAFFLNRELQAIS